MKEQTEVTKLVYDLLEKVFNRFISDVDDVLNVIDMFQDEGAISPLIGQIMAGSIAPEKLERLTDLVAAADLAQLKVKVLAACDKLPAENKAKNDFYFLVQEPRAALDMLEIGRLLYLMDLKGSEVEEVSSPGDPSIFIKQNDERITIRQFIELLEGGRTHAE